MSSLDLLLVTPPSRAEVYQNLSGEFAALEPPVWSSLIAQYALTRGYSVEILDAEAEGLTHAATAQRIIDAAPRLAAFVIYGQQPSASTQCMPGGRKVCEIVKRDSDIPTLVMGTHASALPGRTLVEEPYDFVCEGEGPHTILGLVDVLQGKSRYSEVPGLWYLDDGEVRSNLRGANTRDLDEELPRQAWELLDMSIYRAHNWQCLSHPQQRSPYASLQTSLGCPYSCTFCCINAPFGGKGIRYWSPDHTIAQIDYLVEKHGVKTYKIPDEMFVLNRNHVLGICDRLIERNYGLNIWAYARIDTVQPIFVEKMARAGFQWLGLGIESASKYVRDGVVKGRFGDEDIGTTVKRIRDVGINVSANYIFGLPDDTIDSMSATLDMALELNTEWVNFYSAMAYPGSALYPLAKERGWRLPDDEGGPGWIGYSQHAYETLPLPTEHLAAEQVLDFRDHAFHTYFTSPQYLSMIRDKFGQPAVDHLGRMTGHKLRRRHHDRAAA